MSGAEMTGADWHASTAERRLAFYESFRLALRANDVAAAITRQPDPPVETMAVDTAFADLIAAQLKFARAQVRQSAALAAAAAAAEAREAAK